MKRKNKSKGVVVAGMVNMYGIPTVETQEAPRETAQSFKREYEAAERTRQESARRARCIALGKELLTAPCPFFAEGEYKLDASWELKPNAELLEAVKQAFIKFRADLAERDIQITDGGIQRMSDVTRLNWDCDFTKPEVFNRLFLLMRECDAFEAGDLIDLSVKEIQTAENAEVASVAPLDELENLPDTPEGRSRAREICEAAYYGEQTSRIFADWQSAIYRQWGVILDETQQRACINWFVVNNRSFLSNSWDAMRVSLSRKGILPAMYLPDEQLCNALEDSSSLDDYSTRQSFVAASNRLR